nr:rab5 GDP/GTP exchange factor-like [Parasteatoda tepidariorum]
MTGISPSCLKRSSSKWRREQLYFHNYVIEMDAKIAPQEKISCIVKCSKSIFSLINLQGITASADEFLPTMVYIVLKANPPLLQSNIKYITSFSLPPRLRSGEGAYFFTNLVSYLI